MEINVSIGTIFAILIDRFVEHVLRSMRVFAITSTFGF